MRELRDSMNINRDKSNIDAASARMGSAMSKPWDSQSLSAFSLRSLGGASAAPSTRSFMNLDRLAQRNIQNKLLTLSKPKNKIEVDYALIIQQLEDDVKKKQANLEEAKIQEKDTDFKYT